MKEGTGPSVLSACENDSVVSVWPKEQEAHFRQLRDVLTNLAIRNEFALAFSGGLDSRFLAFASAHMGLRPSLLHVTGPHISSRESAGAREWAHKHGLAFHDIDLDPLALPEVAAGDVKRCYHCKFMLFSTLKKEAGALPLCDGTHASDAKGYRPGLAALKELAVLSPLALAGLDKPDIRALGALLGMDNTDQKPRPCMLTRLPYGLGPTAELLRALDKGEQAIEELFQAWVENSNLFTRAVPDFRLRQISPEELELHVENCENPEFSSFKEQALADAIRQSSGLSLSRIRIMESLSGYYDRPST